MEKNLGFVDRVVRVVLAGICIFAAVFLFEHSIARILAAVAGLFVLGESLRGVCYLHARLGSKSVREPLDAGALYLIGIMGMQMVIAYEWWSAGWEKISGSQFVQGIAGTLGYFASKNPFPWYKAFLLGFATDNATFFAYAVEWSEVVIAIVLALAAMGYVYSRRSAVRQRAAQASLLALIGGMAMNANFYLAAGWTGPGTKGVNVIMFWTQAILCYVWLYQWAHQRNEHNNR